MSTSTFEQEKVRVLSLLKEKQYVDALQILEQVPLAEPAHQQELLELQALAYFKTKQYEQAAACYQRLVELDPRSPKPLVNLGAVYNRMQKYAEAIDALRRAIQRDRNSVDAYYNLGTAQKNSGHRDLAVSAYKEALRINPQLDLAHLNLANVYLDMSNLSMATNHFRTALEISPQLEAAREGMQKAQELEQQRAELNNPFGRLVDAASVGQNASPTIRKLTEGERHNDREELLKLVKGARNAARHVSEELREKMHPALLALTRALIDGENRPDLVEEAYRRFHEELNRFHEGHRYLKRSVLELRGHEEFMNTPDLES